jgi:DNA-binding HxlR family transcriptional regulator
MKWKDLRRQPCSLARTVSVIGDRWTLLILRDCFLRVRRFEEFQTRLGITRRYEYRLTEKGLDLQPVMLAIVHWGDTHMAGPHGRPLTYEHLSCGHAFDPVTVCSACHEAVMPRDVRVRPGPGAPRRNPLLRT